MKLYFHPASTCSRTVVLFAAESGIAYDPVVVDILNGAQFGEAFLAVNPKSMVPVLDDDGFVLSESAAILLYLAEKHGSPALPADLAGRARMHEVMHWLNCDFYKDWGYGLIYPQVFPHHVRQPIEANDVVIRWGQGKVQRHLDYLDQKLLGDGRPYMTGDRLTLADYHAAGLFSAGELIRMDLTPWPNVAAWYGRMQAMGSWATVTEVLHGFVGMLKDKPFVGLK